MDIELWNASDAEKANVIVNHPDVYNWVHGEVVGDIDVTPLLKDRGNVCLGGEHGSILFRQLSGTGIHEIHVQCVPEGRGEWMRKFSNVCLHSMFCGSGAMEIVGRVPKGNVACLSWARSMGFREQWVQEFGYVMYHRLVPTRVMSLTVQDWLRRADHLIGIGRKVLLDNENNVDLQGDREFARHIGLLHEMTKHGQNRKGVVLYNRWASIAEHPLIEEVEDSEGE